MNTEEIVDKNMKRKKTIEESAIKRSKIMKIEKKITYERVEAKSEEDDFAKPVPLITINRENGVFKLTKRGKRILTQVNKPLSVISIVGKYRTGKSYLMNRFFDKQTGFLLGEGIQAETKGIWMWAKPHPRDPDRYLLLLDTEGLYDMEKGDETHDMKIFSLAVLLSGCLVFNAVGTIDDLLVQQLHLVTELSNHIQTGRGTGNGSTEDDDNFSSYFPQFVLVLRDFFLDLVTKTGEPCTPDEYLKNALTLKPGTSSNIRKHNNRRECIRTYFPNRRCFTLPKPVDKDDQLRNMDKVPECEIKKEFLTKSDELISSIIDSTLVFKVNGYIITGRGFLELAEKYLDAINTGRVPNITTSVELVKRTECQMAVEGAVKVHKNHMEVKIMSKLPVTVEQLSQCHKQASAAAIEVYNKRAQVWQDKGEFDEKLMNDMQQEYAQATERNHKESQKFCDQLIQKFFQKIKDDIKGKKYTEKPGGYKMYLADRDEAIQLYHNTTNKGPLGSSVLEQYLENIATEEQAILSLDQALTDKEKQKASKMSRAWFQQGIKNALTGKNRAMVTQMEDESRQHRQMMSNLRTEFEHNTAEQRRQHQQMVEMRQQEFNKLQQEGSEKQQQYRRQLSSVINDNNQLSSRITSTISQISSLSSKCDSLEQSIENVNRESEAKISDLESQIRSFPN